jgi:two-component system, NtrC family, response regulator HydG
LDTNARILIVDDDESIRNTLKSILTDEGYTVDLAATGKEAIEKTSKATFNLIFFDIRLPDTSGVDLLKSVADTVPKTRKVIMTGYPTMQNAIAALNKDADAYLTKPVNIEKLLTTIKEQLLLQENEKKFSEFKIAEFIETRVKELSSKT